MTRQKAIVTRLVVAAAALLPACAPAGLTFYDVQRSRTEQCAIRSNGEFCVEPEQFAPPVFEAWAVDLGDDADLLYVDEQVWVLAPLSDGDDPQVTPRKAQRSRVVSAGDALCTTTETQTVEFVADALGLAGTYEMSTRLDGPAACGTTPVGERIVEDLTGQAGTP
jgi:hypothetical protein